MPSMITKLNGFGCFSFREGNEMFTDSFKYTLVDDIVYEVEAKYKVILQGFDLQ